MTDLFKCQQFIKDQTGMLGSDIVAAIGLERNGEVIAVTGFNGFIANTCQVHFCIKDDARATKDYVKYVFHYIFNEALVENVIAIVYFANEKIVRLARHLGFKDIAFIPNSDVLILSLNKKQCKWVNYE